MSTVSMIIFAIILAVVFVFFMDCIFAICGLMPPIKFKILKKEFKIGDDENDKK
jgi:hypothetical protein